MDVSLAVKLQELILAAGGQARLALLLGVEQRVVSDWKRAGQISRIGALLVERSSLLSQLFRSEDLRPDLEAEEAKGLRRHQKYEDARFRQIEYENNPDYAQSPLYYISSRLGIVNEVDDDS